MLSHGTFEFAAEINTPCTIHHISLFHRFSRFAAVPHLSYTFHFSNMPKSCVVTQEPVRTDTAPIHSSQMNICTELFWHETILIRFPITFSRKDHGKWARKLWLISISSRLRQHGPSFVFRFVPKFWLAYQWAFRVRLFAITRPMFILQD